MAVDQLIERAIHGDQEALVALLEEVGPLVRPKVAERIPNKFRSLISEDDVMQQTYADAFRSIRRFVPLGEGAFRAWLAAIAEANLRDAVKGLEADRRGGAVKQVQAPSVGDSYVLLFDALSSSGTSPSGQASRSEIQEAVRSAVLELPIYYRTVVSLMDLEGRSAREVAQAMDRSLGAVYMLRARAHDRIRDALGAASKFFKTAP